MKSSDEILIDGLKGGDREAQQRLYDRYSAALMAISMRYMGERESAEDLLHDAYIKIFGSIRTFKYRGEGSLRAWMSRIVVNTALEELRRRKRTVMVPLDDTGAHSGSIAELESVDGHEVERVPQQVLLRLIAELPDGYRTVFNLFCVEGYSHREIARELGINEKSSSSQLLRAKRLLATKINKYLNVTER